MKPKRVVLKAIILSILIVFTTVVIDSTFSIANQGVEEQKIPEQKIPEQKIPEGESARGQTRLYCEVKWVGPGWGRIYFKLTDLDGSFRDRWFIAREDQKKEMLATGLTAITNNFNVYVYLSDTAPDSEILTLYLMR